MRVPKGLQTLLANFVFRDCRIESHPRVLSSHVYFAVGESHLDLVARVSKNAIPFGKHRIDADHGVTGYAWRKRQVVLMSDINPLGPHGYKADFLKGANVQSFLAVPIGDGSEVIGVLNMLSTEKGFFRPEDTGWDVLLEEGLRKANPDKAIVIGGLQVELQTQRERSPLRSH